MNIYLPLILTIIIGVYWLDLMINRLNLKHMSPDLPEEFKGFMDAEQYRKAQNYLQDNTRFDMVRQTIFTGVTVAFILAGGFAAVDTLARSAGFGMLGTGLIFAGILVVSAKLLFIPFSVHHTFVIEARYGFNRTTGRTFVLDQLKALGLLAVLGGGVFAVVLKFFEAAGGWGWVAAWLAVTVFQLFLLFLAPVVILPLFNRFTPLAEGSLKQAIEQLAREQGFQLRGIFTMDGSRRSTKANAFFTGFGRYRRIALFDTLIARQSEEELLGVLAHEIGHYKRRHVLKFLGLSCLTTGLMLFILSLFLNSRGLFDAFRMEQMSVHAGIFLFAFLYTPIDLALSLLTHAFSRRYEFEADAFAVAATGKPDSLITALKKLSVLNLANLTPHPLKVFFSYSHPPILQRLDAIRRLGRT